MRSAAIQVWVGIVLGLPENSIRQSRGLATAPINWSRSEQRRDLIGTLVVCSETERFSRMKTDVNSMDARTPNGSVTEQVRRPIASGATSIAVMQAADHWFGHNAPAGNELHGSRHRGVAIKGHRRPGIVIIIRIRGHNPVQMPLIQDDDMVQVFATQRAMPSSRR